MKAEYFFTPGIFFILISFLDISITTPFLSLARDDAEENFLLKRVQMMDGPGMHCRKMHCMSESVPPGTTPERLPDADNPGAKVLTHYCSQCHNLPSPAMHTAEEWQSVLTRMVSLMEKKEGRGGMMGGMMNLQIPTSEEQNSLLNYLRKYALRPGKFESTKSAGLTLFRRICSQCHALPDPRLHHDTEWPSVVDRMRQNMRSMGKPEISDEETHEILGFLKQYPEPSP